MTKNSRRAYKGHINKNHLVKIRYKPHLLGWAAGKELLTELHSYWIMYIWDTNVHRSLQAHRGSYKTTAILEVGILWWLLFHPNDRIGMLRKSFNEAWAIAESICDLLRLPEVKEIFWAAHGTVPEILKKDKSSGIITFSFKQKITKEGSLNVFGITTGITGTHVDKFICDDFVTLKDKTSKAEREKTKDLVREILSNIIDPGKECAFIGTPWHKDDAWTVVPEPIKFDWTVTDILTKEEVQEKKDLTTKKLFAANYLLKHIASEDTIFKDMEEAIWDWKVSSSIAHVDAKFKGDHTGGLTIGIKRSDGSYQLTGRVYYRHVKETIVEMVDLLVKYRSKEIWVEENPDKGWTGDELQKEIAKRGLRIAVRTYWEEMNKHNKIIAYLKGNWNQIIWDRDPESEEYKAQILDYEEGEEPDDCADSAASLMRKGFAAKNIMMALYQK